MTSFSFPKILLVKQTEHTVIKQMVGTETTEISAVFNVWK